MTHFSSDRFSCFSAVANLTSDTLPTGISTIVGMLGTVLIEVAAGLALLAAWYLYFQRDNRKRSSEVVEWIRTAFAGHAHIRGIQWTTASRFHVRLELPPNLFPHAHVTVQFVARELPLNWLLSVLRRQSETLTFEADLDSPPGFNLEVHNRRWHGQTRRLDAERAVYEHCGPFVLTTRSEWQRDITVMMNALVASRDSDFLSVTFRKTSPHLSATVPLSSLAECGGNGIFSVLRELADCASASRFWD